MNSMMSLTSRIAHCLTPDIGYEYVILLISVEMSYYYSSEVNLWQRIFTVLKR